MKPRLIRALVVAMFLAAIYCSNHRRVFAQNAEDETTVAKPDVITTDKVEILRKQVEASTELDADAKAIALDSVQQATEELKKAAQSELDARNFAASVETAQDRLDDQKRALTDSNEPSYEDLPATPAISDLQAAVAKREPFLQKAKSELAEREAEPASRVERRKQLTEWLAKHAEVKSELETQLKAATPPDEPPLQTAARHTLLETQILAADRAAPAWQQELSLFDTEKAVGLPALRIQVQKRTVSRLEKEIAELNDRIEQKRQAEARTQVEELREFAATIQDTSLRKRADEIADLAVINRSLTADITKSTSELETASKELDTLTALYSRMRDKEDIVGLTEAVGLELRRNLRNLPDIADLRRESTARQELMRQIQYKQLSYQDNAAVSEQEIDRLDGIETRSTTEDLELRIEKARRAILLSLDKNFNDQFNKISGLDSKQQQIVKTAEDFRTYINERVLWIRSNRVFGVSDVSESASTFGWLLTPKQWRSVIDAIRTDCETHFPLYAIVVLTFIAILCLKHRIRSEVKRIGERAARLNYCDFPPTIRVAFLTMLIALPWSMLFGFLGWRLLSPPTGSAFSVAVGSGTIAVALIYGLFNYVRQTCRPFGLGIAHFNWPAAITSMLRRRIVILLAVILPFVFVVATLHARENPQGHNALERLAMIAALLVLAWFLYGILHPRRGVFRRYISEHKTGWTYRLRAVWYPLSFGLPIVLAVMVFVGYFFTAEELTWRLEGTIWCLVGLFFLREFLVRWFVVNHRRLRIEQARERRAEMAEQSTTSTDPDSELIAHAIAQSPEEQESDLQIVGEQTNRLISTGLLLAGLVVTWFLWVDVLPALRVLDHFELWTTTAQHTVETLDAAGVRTVRSEQRVVPVTIASVLFAILLGTITITAARNVPGLLEIAILQRLPLQVASRYAIRTVTRYVIMVVGIALTFGAIGIGWAKVQWLAAALTVGLGFGLQEIFANFVSGLIILFERPIRIGDVVTIDNVSGTVSRIQIRATTITDWDRKDYIVPNKEFVTGRLLNWTLLDSTNRVVIHVGVAYGTDTVHARSLLLKIAQAHERILSDPAAIATFEGFADSSLTLSLRCYLPNLDHRTSTISDLHEMIDEEFKQAGIEIAFPQHDLHIRTQDTQPGPPNRSPDEGNRNFS